MPPSRPEDGARYGGMAGADERGSRGLDLPPGMSLRDIEVDPDLDSVHDAELGLEVRRAPFSPAPR